jgi:hypothetical protein
MERSSRPHYLGAWRVVMLVDGREEEALLEASRPRTQVPNGAQWLLAAGCKTVHRCVATAGALLARSISFAC